jgi:hypothetical protein
MTDYSFLKQCQSNGFFNIRSIIASKVGVEGLVRVFANDKKSKYHSECLSAWPIEIELFLTSKTLTNRTVTKAFTALTLRQARRCC